MGTTHPSFEYALEHEHELSERQRDVLRLIAKGHTNREIADMLGITLDGAKWHVSEILSRLGLDTREEAAEFYEWRRRPLGRFARWMRGIAAAPAFSWSTGAVAAGGAVVAITIAGVAVLSTVSGDNGGSADPAMGDHELVEGESVFGDRRVYHPEAFANTVTRQVNLVVVVSESGEPLPGPTESVFEIWVERDPEGYGTAMYSVSYDAEGELESVFLTAKGEQWSYTPGGFQNCTPLSELLAEPGFDVRHQPSPLDEVIGLPVSLDSEILRASGMSRDTEDLPVAVPDSIELSPSARESYAPNFDAVEAWSGTLPEEVLPGEHTVWIDDTGLQAASRYVMDDLSPGEPETVHIVLLTEVFDLDDGIEARRAAIPWEEWCPE